MPVPTKKTKKELEAAEAAAMSSSGSKAAAATAGKGGESSGSEESDEEGSSEEDEEEEETSKKANNGAVPNAAQKSVAPPAAVNLIDMGLFGGDAPAPPVQSPTPAAAGAPKPAAALDLMDLFGGGAPAATAQAAPAASNGSFDLFGNLPPAASPSGGAPAASSSLDLFGAPASAASSPVAATPGVQTFPSELVFESKGVSVHFSYSRPTATPEVLSVTASFSNSNPFPLTNFDFQVAVLKHVQLAMQPATSTTIPAQSTKQVTQQLTLNNSMHGKKKLLIRVKIDYKANGQPVTETTQIGKFPD
jgi:AP-1 complex subunit gamma-1